MCIGLARVVRRAIPESFRTQVFEAQVDDDASDSNEISTLITTMQVSMTKESTTLKRINCTASEYDMGIRWVVRIIGKRLELQCSV